MWSRLQMMRYQRQQKKLKLRRKRRLKKNLQRKKKKMLARRWKKQKKHRNHQLCQNQHTKQGPKRIQQWNYSDQLTKKPQQISAHLTPRAGGRPTPTPASTAPGPAWTPPACPPPPTPPTPLTLGRTNWPLLKETYEALANDMQWKVRRTLASSIHELGVILGEEVAASDLVPIFNGFIKDLDEVRIGILKHLADFLKLLNKNDRNEYLPRLEEFLKMDNERNWRFRLELTEQLGVLVPLFKPEDIRDHLAPIALTLVQDKVSSVRQAATGVICTLLANLNSTGDVNLSRAITADLAENLAHSSHWARRQTFAVLCGELLTTIPYQHFTQDLLPHLLDLTWDIVPNVRLKVAHVFGHILPDEHYNDTTNQNYEQIHQALNHLAGDKDHDVREAAAQADRVKPNPPPKPEVPVEPVLESKPPEEEAVPTWAKIAEVIQEIK